MHTACRPVVALIVVAAAVAGCGKSSSSTHRPGELSTAEKIDNLCFHIVSQLNAARQQALYSPEPVRGEHSRRVGLALGEKYTLELTALKSAPVMVSIAREARAVPVPAFAHTSDASFVRALESGAVGFRTFARRLHDEAALANEFAHYAAASVAPARPALAACRATVETLKRRKS